MAKARAPKAKFVKAGQACPAGWTRRVVRTRGGRLQDLCVKTK